MFRTVEEADAELVRRLQVIKDKQVRQKRLGYFYWFLVWLAGFGCGFAAAGLIATSALAQERPVEEALVELRRAELQLDYMHAIARSLARDQVWEKEKEVLDLYRKCLRALYHLKYVEACK